MGGEGKYEESKSGVVVATEALVAYEQSRVDAAYLLAEDRAESLGATLYGGITAGNNKAADTVANRYRERIAQLRYMIDNPALMVYGRVDISEDPDAGALAGETFYVGPGALHDETDPRMIAWESGIAAAFRDPTTWRNGRAVAARRQFQGANRVLTDVVETVYSEGQPEPGGGDPLLDLLGKRRGGELHEVVATIRQEQFELMEVEPAATMVIQGGPGTGKTIVGLHRLSVLLFRSGGEIREGDVLVITPSETLIKYIRHVLPEIGRAAIDHRPITAVGAHGVEARLRDDASVSSIKGRPVMAELIDRYLERGIKPPHGDLEITPTEKVTEDAARRAFNDALQARTYAAKRSRFRDSIARLTSGRVPRSTLDDAISRVLPGPSERRVVNELLSSPRVLSEVAQGLLTDSEQAAVLRPPSPVQQTPWTIEDLPLLDEAAWQLRGSERVGQRFKHIIVDEAQDLSPMQLRVVARRVADDGGCTILGDLAQATRGWALRSWSDHLAEAGLTADRYAKLTTGYRIPHEQLDYANRLLDVIDVEVPPTLSIIPDDDEAEPCLLESTNLDGVVRDAMDIVDSLLDRDDGGRLAIGCIGHDDELRALSEHLEASHIAHEWAAKSTAQPVTLVPADDAKGLEFDHVVVLEPGKIYRSHPTLGPRLLYVAMTRARGTLSLLHTTALPPVLTDGPDSGTAVDVTPTSPVATPTLSEAEAQSERRIVRVGERLLQVSWERQGAASIEDLPLVGGAPSLVAEGFVCAGDSSLAWALRTSQGHAIALTTTSGAQAAADDVARATVKTTGL